MEKLKNIWKDINNPAKIFIVAVVVILIIVLVNYVV